MHTHAFLKRLRTELPRWVQQGWVSPQHSQSILEDVSRRADGSPRYVVAALALMGALLLGVGAITFFAANWGVMPKALKLALLFAALGASYVAAGICLARGLAAVGHGLVLLGVLLFGANVFLIAQIYHIDAHFPDGVLVWALGALLAAWLADSQAALIAAVALALLWSGTETFAFERNPHWLFFLPLILGGLLIYVQRGVTALRVACWALLAWCLTVVMAGQFLGRRWIDGEQLALVQIYLFGGISLYIVGRGFGASVRATEFAPPVIMAGVLWAVTALFVLTFPEAHRVNATNFGPTIPVVWLWITVAVEVFVAALMVWRYQDTEIATLPSYRKVAFVLLGLLGALALANLWRPGEYAGWIALGYNVVAFAGVVWIVMTGLDRGERRLVNLGFGFFAALLLARYFDTFWTLLDRAYFFMIGGVLLLIAGVVLERSRRRLTARIAAGSA